MWRGGEAARAAPAFLRERARLGGLAAGGMLTLKWQT